MTFCHAVFLISGVRNDGNEENCESLKKPYLNKNALRITFFFITIAAKKSVCAAYQQTPAILNMCRYK